MADDPRQGGGSDDETLVAYLDDALPPGERPLLEARLAADGALTARLTELRGGSRDFAGAFDALLRSAPNERLSAILAQAVRASSNSARPAPHEAGRPYRRRIGLAAAAAVALLVLGATAGQLLPRVIGSGSDELAVEDESPDYWRQAVAEYLTLYTPETLAGIPDDPALRSRELAAAGAPLSLDLGLDKVALPGLGLKRAQIFALDRRPLAQVAYLSDRDGPIAFCIIAGVDGAAPRRFEERLGRAVVFWSKGGRGYMLIGQVPRQELEAYAATLDGQVS